MKKIYEILKIEPDHWESMSEPEKVQKIIEGLNRLNYTVNRVAELPRPDKEKFDKRDFAHFFGSWDQVFKRYSHLVSKLEKKNFSLGGKAFLLDMYLKNESEYVKESFKLLPPEAINEWFLRVLDEVRVLSKEFNYLLLYDKNEKQDFAEERKRSLKDTIEAVTARIYPAIEECFKKYLKEFIANEIEKEWNKELSFELLGYDFAKCEELFGVEYLTEINEIEKKLREKIEALKNPSQQQTKELTTLKEDLAQHQKTTQQLTEEKTKWEQEKENWQKREQQLLTEIELLKNPPLTNSNKENSKEKTIVKEVIKEVIIKNLENNNKELGLNLSSQEKNKLNNLSLEEIQNYQNQLIKNKFNALKSEVKQLTSKDNNLARERERERERESKNPPPLTIDWFTSSHRSQFYSEKN